MALRSKSEAQISKEAADWVACLEGTPSPAERAAFIQWRDSDARHAKAYDRMMAVWVTAAKMQRPAPTPRSYFARPAFAAGMALLLVGSAIVFSGALSPVPTAILATSISETRELQLKDGSTLVLEPGSKAAASLDGSKRYVRLYEGRAQFRIVKGDYPFTVEVADHEVKAREGRFEVLAGDARSLVLPQEGQLLVRPAGWTQMFAGSQRIGPGERLVITANDETVEIAALQSGDLASRMVEFDQMPLGDAVKVMNGDSRVKLQLSSAAVGKLKISGAFRNGDMAAFAEAVAVALSLELEQLPSGALLLKRKE